MVSISDKDVYSSAQALLDKHDGNKDYALAEVMQKFIKYTKEGNEEMLFITIEIGQAIRELTNYDYIQETLN